MTQRTSPLLTEWLRLPQPNDKTFAWLAEQGVTIKATIRAGGVGIAKIATVGKLWHLSPTGQAALIVPVFDHPAPSPWNAVEVVDLMDLIATSPTDPESWWLRSGRGQGLLLGHEYLDAHEAGDPVRVFGSPLDWLKADCDGVVFLEWAANLRDRRRLRQQMEIAA